MRNPRALVFLVLILAIINIIKKVDAPPQLPLVKADYQRCVHVEPGPLVQRRGVNLYPQRKDIA